MLDYINKKRDCTKCGKILDYDCFNWDYRRNLPRSVCKDCDSKIDKKYYKDKKEFIK